MLKPLGRRVLVKLTEKKQESSLIIMPEKEENIRQAVVIASGIDEVHAGDTVLLNVVGAVSTPEGKLVSEANVLGVLE